MPDHPLSRFRVFRGSVASSQDQAWQEKSAANALDGAYGHMAHAIRLLQQVEDQPKELVRAALARHRITPLTQPGDVFTQAGRLRQVLQALRDKVEAPD